MPRVRAHASSTGSTIDQGYANSAGSYYTAREGPQFASGVKRFRISRADSNPQQSTRTRLPRPDMEVSEPDAVGALEGWPHVLGGSVDFQAEIGTRNSTPFSLNEPSAVFS